MKTPILYEWWKKAMASIMGSTEPATQTRAKMRKRKIAFSLLSHEQDAVSWSKAMMAAQDGVKSAMLGSPIARIIADTASDAP